MAKELCLGFEITELRLGLPRDYNNGVESVKEKKKRVFSEMITSSLSSDTKNDIISIITDDDSPATKNQVVGWPPICSYRKKNNDNKESLKKIGYVKVSMDGVPYLRKIDLRSSHGYDDLANIIENFFNCRDLGLVLKDDENSEYVIIYKDKDEDWMLIGDVPWQMFIESCKRLRIMKRSDAIDFGL